MKTRKYWWAYQSHLKDLGCGFALVSLYPKRKTPEQVRVRVEVVRAKKKRR